MLTDWRFRFRSLFRRDAVERELENELQSHFDHLVDSHVHNGLAHDEAVRRARLELGGVDQIKEEHRDARGIAVIDDFARDVRYAFRQLRRAPGFAALAVLCLGLGIGVNTAIFGVINAVILRPMPVADPERLILFTRGQDTAWSYPAYRDFRDRSRAIAGITAAFPMESDLDVDGESDFVTSEMVPANYGTVLGVTPSLGRWFFNDTEPVAVISHAVWQRRFHSSADVLGRQIRSGSETYTIVGVAPPEYNGAFAPMRTDIWVPIGSRSGLSEQLADRSRTWRGLMLFGRLAAGATAAQGAAELNAIDAQLVAEHGPPPQRHPPIVADHVRGLPDPAMRRRLATMTTLLAAVVALILMIACVNIGNLLLVRGALRQREFIVRRALGASRFRLLQQLLTESLVLAIGGGICGAILGAWTNRLLESSLPSILTGFALHLDLSLDWRAFLFVTLVALVTTLLCGLLPAWRSSRALALVTFKAEIGGGRPRRRPLGLVAQVVMSLVLLFVAGSVLQALLRLQAPPPGFDVGTRLYAYTFLPSSSSASDGRAFYSQALDEVRALPGIRAAAITSSLLTPIRSSCVAVPGGPRMPTTISEVDGDYFGIMGIALVAGRTFSGVDVSAADSTIVLNESLARRVWPDGRGLGERVMIGCDTTESAVVAGVVGDSVVAALNEPGQPHLYRHFVPQRSRGFAAIVMQTSGDSAAMVQSVRLTLLAMGQGIRIYTVAPLAAHVDQRYAPLRWLARMLTGFGVLALVLAAVGLYGVIAYRVALRTQEIGVRMALGASRSDVFREVLTHGLAIVLVGVAIGEVLTAALTGLAASLQDGIAPTGVSTHVSVALIWILVALGACYVPAARAARVDPMVALRHE